MSSYLEALGLAQEVGIGANIVFATGDDDIDIVGSDIALDATGTEFTLLRPGLYHVEWSMNLGTATQPVVIGLMEQGQAESPMPNSVVSGNLSSGALIYVAPGEIPYTVRLFNYGGPLTLASTEFAGNIAASIRILRFADGPN